jgi:hypothetical protein
MKRFAMLLLLTILLGAASSVLAMSSTNYRLDWFTPLTGGGGAMASASYAAGVTVGQTAVGEGASTNYGTGLGFWYGMLDWLRIYLPLVLRNFP